MNREVRLLFHELIGLPENQRLRILQERNVNPALRAEVESLLSFDSADERGLSDSVSNVAAQVLESASTDDITDCGPYHLIRLIGSGGMGAVYLAERSGGEIEQHVAVKLLRADHHRHSWRERFLRERQLLASLQHPSIVHVIDAGHTEDERPYLVMEYVEGVKIDEFAEHIDVRARLRLFLRVCEGVAHAHRRLVIHRDLKPSNILVDASGQPKLLDFGIAKLLDDTGDLTQTLDRLLTPKYASPEQLAGAAQTTATDIYSLGAVLYKLLTGTAPREGHTATADAEILPPSRLNPDVPADLDYIVAMALRTEPDDRYVSVDEFAADIRAALAWRPVRARSGNLWYRTRRYLRRYWIPMTAALFVVAGLSTGVYIANRERLIAEQGFADVRRMANKLFDIENETRKLEGSTKTRQFIVDTALEYLRRVTADVRLKPDMALEVGNAYLRVARVQGVPISSNLGQMRAAGQSLQLASQFVQAALHAQPSNRVAILRSAQIAHDRMLLARYENRNQDAGTLAREADAWLVKLDPGKADIPDASAILVTYLNVADQYGRTHRYDDALRVSTRARQFIHVANRPDYLPDFLWVSADVFRNRGNLDQALNEINQSVALLDPATGPNEQWRVMNYILSLVIKAEILGAPDTINFGRSAEAVTVLDQAFDLSDQFVHKDPADQSVRSRLANAGVLLGAILRTSDPKRSLAIYDHTLSHVAEIQDNNSFRRFEVTILAGSSYALRKLGRSAESKQRLTAALDRLNQLHLYPAATIDIGSEAEETLRALAADEAARGNLPRARDLYTELLSKLHPTDTVSDKIRISDITREQTALNSKIDAEPRRR